VARLSDDLRRLPDDALMRLFAQRDDLQRDPPADVNALAQRLATPHGVLVGLEALDLPTLQVCHHLLLAATHPLGAGRVRLPDLAEWIPFADEPDVDVATELAAAVQRLREAGLAHGDPAKPISGLRHTLALPTAAGRTAARLLELAPDDTVRLLAPEHDVDPGDLAAARVHLADRVTRLGPRLLDGVAPAAVDLLLGLVEGREYVVRLPGGRIGGWAARWEGLPVLGLVRCGAVVPLTPEVGEVPRELRLGLLAEPDSYLVRFAPPPAPPAPDEPARRAAEHDAAERARRVVGLVERLLERWSREPGIQLASGGLGVKELRRLGKFLEVDEWEAGRVAELALLAGLVAQDGRSGDVLPSSAYDDWLEQDVVDQWAALVRAWWESDRLPSAAGSRYGGSVVPALHYSPSPGARAERHRVLRLLADTSGLTEVDVAARSHWAAPARWSGQESPEPAVLGAYVEALLLGLISGAPLPGVVAPWGPDGSPDWPGPQVLARLAAAFPEPVESVTLQADLTAIATGPVSVDVARVLDLLADVESRGAATVWRFGPDSVRRAFDDGWDADQVLAALETVAAKGVPGTLATLVADVARTHGRVRVGAAAAYVRCADEVVLAELQRTRKLGPLKLRAVAPLVAVSPAKPAKVVELLRAAGFSPAADEGGGVTVSRPAARRGSSELPAALRIWTTTQHRRSRGTMDPGVWVRRLRAVDEPEVRRLAEALDRLAAAAERGSRVRLTYVGRDGRKTQHQVVPLVVDGSRVVVQRVTPNGPGEELVLQAVDVLDASVPEAGLFELP
jgi:hypothetical protein